MPKYAVVTTIVIEAQGATDAIDQILEHLEDNSRMVRAFAVRYSEVIEWEIEPLPRADWKRGRIIKNEWT